MSVKVGDCLISNRTTYHYFRCVLDKDLSGMAMNVLGKFNYKTTFLPDMLVFSINR